MNKTTNILALLTTLATLGCSDAPRSACQHNRSTESTESTETFELRQIEETGDLSDPAQCLHFEIVMLGECKLNCDGDPCLKLACEASCDLEFFTNLIEVCKLDDRANLCGLDTAASQLQCADDVINGCGPQCAALCSVCSELSSC